VTEVARAGETVRRSTGHWSDAVHALLRHFERAGFDGAPRYLGQDEQGREILSFVEGETDREPPLEDEPLVALGALLRRMHEAQAGFERPPDSAWFTPTLSGPVVCHGDLYPPNVVRRDGLPVALIDWDLAGPGNRLIDVASAAYHWAPLRVDGPEELSVADRGRRARAVCDGYGLPAEERAQLVELNLAMREHGYELHHRLGGVERLAGWRDMWDGGSGERIRANAAWLVRHRSEIERALA
jgi:hypothetical protein